MPDQTAKSLSQLGLTASDGRDVRVTGLSVDSRNVKAGHLFAALPGTKFHGGEFIQFALRMGAGSILTDRAGADIAKVELSATPDVPVVLAEDPRQTLAYASALWFGAQPEVMVAATGTNGKTSVATFTRQIWELMGIAAANLGTTGVEGAFKAPLAHTTPEPITLHRLLAEMAGAGVTHAAMEASSHGLAQRRLDGVQLAAAAFTNFTQDHLDYHASFEEYFGAKVGLFSRVLSEDGTAVINIDDPKGETVVEIARARGQRVITVGRSRTADLLILGQRYDPTGQELLFEWEGTSRQVRLALVGGFQAENVLAAAGLVIGTGSDASEVFDTLQELQTVTGRMQLAATRENGAPVYVDYSHTPDAVATALNALRPHVMGRLIVVLGAGGDRDTSKRVLMGQAAAENADVVFVTDDNPRSEDPSAIRAMVMSGCPQAKEVGDRAEAILRGVDALGPGDALLIAGKGHETGQVVGDDVLPFNDVEQASVAVAALEGRLA
ncbi:UDP-N-acetylmuramoyl-L-alanyl-D-glutamate--2,6-diaminopimelate ligase [Pseudohalocynthiibacter aestuariivivens]|jgi:UDP-N-acetylmuramoyl-L-alanyl-D-glutamate--2,6-diaminopimelate ligase|uniref:UDP-N-acetylmuramoyl-L-alanyl-D-glutamate--2,6-diaminopimelate ligase n=1 Tax=Pseudohalocynthiibacter aestuariivivens TaxID=1591409 RepID=A0ABV5JA27_9RHOB|nr:MULTISPECIES: UDP-N-acetylmuramoyl-L-alanyl-D-glutamate--2,6-diaminopimelate ligase [Pseudohalocynthiibacter]MBS9716885.1 UDP-N-acetylmuramoyl-L-alanyl-D-glutamate--2,6-diaminopimelate ligase [Pseudohalocynthiibacter aestuariivivens]MCK0102022.1 UDP-N-acetylmuramoyl-L-alanyl-D-glutamate--2,6-diaminopimelate ligase [Pseudohalocynthiibacter sp. F2068]